MVLYAPPRGERKGVSNAGALWLSLRSLLTASDAPHVPQAAVTEREKEAERYAVQTPQHAREMTALSSSFAPSLDTSAGDAPTPRTEAKMVEEEMNRTEGASPRLAPLPAQSKPLE